MEPQVPVMMPRLVMMSQVLGMVPRPVMMPRAPVMVPRVLAGESLAGLPQARAAEVAQEAVSAMRRPPAHVCRSNTSP
jgi:hypothetical protein